MFQRMFSRFHQREEIVFENIDIEGGMENQL